MYMSYLDKKKMYSQPTTISRRDIRAPMALFSRFGRIPGGGQYGAAYRSFSRGGQGDFLGALARIAGAVVKPLANLVPKNTILSRGLQAAGLATRKIIAPVALGAAGAALVQGGGAPALPATIPGMGGFPTPTPAGGGLLPMWRGPGGKLQFPWQDPQQILQPPYAYDDSYLRIQYRAPRGYVVVRDPQGRRYAMAKGIARSMGLWTQARKPPISAGDWHKYQTAQTVEKKLRKLASKALRGRGKRGKGSGLFIESRPIAHSKVK